MWLFDGINTYTEMRKKIAHAVFYISLIQVFVLAQISSDFSEILKTFSFATETEIFDIKIYVAYIYLPIIFSVLENIFRLHDKIGKIFKIRDIFAKKVILNAYISELAINITDIRKKDIYNIYEKNKNLRDSIGNHFYDHVSCTNPKIDEHYVQMALTSWTWVWILLDSIIITVLLDLTSIIWKVNFKFIIGISIFIVVQIILLIVVICCECRIHTIKEIHQAFKYDKQNNNGLSNNKLKEVIINALPNRQISNKIGKRRIINKTGNIILHRKASQ